MTKCPECAWPDLHRLVSRLSAECCPSLATSASSACWSRTSARSFRGCVPSVRLTHCCDLRTRQDSNPHRLVRSERAYPLATCAEAVTAGVEPASTARQAVIFSVGRRDQSGAAGSRTRVASLRGSHHSVGPQHQCCARESNPSPPLERRRSFAGRPAQQGRRWESNPRAQSHGLRGCHYLTTPRAPTEGIEPPLPPSQGGVLSIGPRGHVGGVSCAGSSLAPRGGGGVPVAGVEPTLTVLQTVFSP